MLKKDSEWKVVEEEALKVIEFYPSASVNEGKITSLKDSEPYASIIIECKKLSGKTKAFITHKEDFLHLWQAFKERGVSKEEEIIIFWTTKKYKTKLIGSVSAFLPKLIVMVFPKGAYEIMTDPNHRPDMTGEARAKVTMPIMEWKPEIIN